MLKKRNFLDTMAFALDLPGEAPPGLPLIEIAGEGRVLIENHHGVVVYENTKIHIRVSYGQVHICGCNLRLAQMTKHQIVIVGKIEGVNLCRGGNR